MYKRSTIYLSTYPQGEQNETEKCSYRVDWLLKGIRYGPAKMVTRVFQNVHDIQVKVAEATILNVKRQCKNGGSPGVMVIVLGNGHGDTSSNPGLIAFHIALIPLGKGMNPIILPPAMGK